MGYMLWLAVWVLLLPADAQPSAWPIEKLTVEGNRNYSTEQILAVGGLKAGQMAGKAEFEAARDRLLATGVFESVGYKFEAARNSKGYAASFQVVETGPLFPMRFDDLGAAPDEIREWLRRTEPLYAAKIPGTPALLEHYAKAIEKFLETKGLKKQVAGTLNGDNPSEVLAVFRPAGRLPVIAEVRFTGNAVVPAFALQNAIMSSAVGVPYNEARFRLTLDSTIRPLYEKRGRIRVSFPGIQVEPAKNVTGRVVTVSIKEGESYQLGKVKVEGAGLAPEALLKTGAFKTGDPVDFDQVQEGVDRIRKKLGSTGYLHPDIDVKREVDDRAKSVT